MPSYDYNQFTLYTTQNTSSGNHIVNGQNQIKQLHRVTNLGWNQIQSTQILRELGSDEITKVALDTKRVGLSYSYYATNGYNENLIGLVTNSTSGDNGIVANILTGDQNLKNYYILVNQEGKDNINRTTPAAEENDYVVGIGDVILNSLSFSASVGDFPQLEVQAEGLNYRIDKYEPINAGSGSAFSPSIIPNAYTGNVILPSSTSGDMRKVIPKGDIMVIFTNDFLGIKEQKTLVQSVNFDIQLGRRFSERMGAYTDYDRKLDKVNPYTVNFSLTPRWNSMISGSKLDIENICESDGYSFGVLMKSNCTGDFDYGFFFDRMTLSSMSNQVDNKYAIDLTFEASDIADDFAPKLYTGGGFYSEQTGIVGTGSSNTVPRTIGTGYKAQVNASDNDLFLYGTYQTGFPNLGFRVETGAAPYTVDFLMYDNINYLASAGINVHTGTIASGQNSVFVDFGTTYSKTPTVIANIVQDEVDDYFFYGISGSSTTGTNLVLSDVLAKNTRYCLLSTENPRYGRRRPLQQGSTNKRVVYLPTIYQDTPYVFGSLDFSNEGDLLDLMLRNRAKNYSDWNFGGSIPNQNYHINVLALDPTEIRVI